MEHIRSANEIRYATSDKVLHYVVFYLWGIEFCIDIMKVQQINSLEEVVCIQNPLKHIKGVIYVQGEVIPIIDLRKRFCIPGDNKNNLPVIVVKLFGEVFGFVVDGISELVSVSDSTIHPTPFVVAGISTEYILAILKTGNRMLTLLDFDQVIIEDYEAIKMIVELGARDHCRYRHVIVKQLAAGNTNEFNRMVRPGRGADIESRLQFQKQLLKKETMMQKSNIKINENGYLVEHD